MNCLFILLLLSCCGNFGGICGCNNGNDNNCGCGCENANDSCGERERREERRERREERRESCDISDARPSNWSDCGCDNDSSRRNDSRNNSPRQDFPGFNRGETCGCENQD